MRALGPQATWYLQSVDLKRLDAEQRFRIQRILRGLTSPNREDTADQVAQWLAGDPRAWLILLNHDEESTRRRALEQLTYLLDRSIPFDPTADAQTRKTQREQLRAGTGELMRTRRRRGNDECRKPNDEGMTKPKPELASQPFRASSFGFRASFVIWLSSFVISHSVLSGI